MNATFTIKFLISGGTAREMAPVADLIKPTDDVELKDDANVNECFCDAELAWTLFAVTFLLMLIFAIELMFIAICMCRWKRANRFNLFSSEGTGGTKRSSNIVVTFNARPRENGTLSDEQTQYVLYSCTSQI